MAQVTTQAQLAAAIRALDPDIQIAADFYINSTQVIEYPVTISSTGSGPYTLTKAGGYTGSLFAIQNSGSLTLQNIILDGAKATITPIDDAPLVSARSGTLIVAAGAVLQNNNASGIQALEDPSVTVTIIVQSNAVIRGNTTSSYGGGIYSAGGSGRITIRGGSQITQNRAASGGGIYHTGNQILTLADVTLHQNTAATGQGVYNAGPLELGPRVDSRDSIYLRDQEAVPTIIEHLTTNSVVQLETSSYVTPSQTESPIVVALSDLELTAADEVTFRVPPNGFNNWGFYLSGDTHQVLLAPVEYTLQYENTLGSQNPNPLRYTVATPTITLLPLTDTPGSRFLGWFDAPEGGVEVTVIPLGSTGDKTLYARWQVVAYTVIYYGNDTGGPAAENVPLPQQVQGGESVLLSNGRPNRAGYMFTSWNTDPAGTGTTYQPGEVLPNVLADTSLYAQWERVEHTLTYHGNDQGGPPAQNIPGPVPVPNGQSVALSRVIPAREGFDFCGWNTSPNGTGAPYQPGDIIPDIRADIDLYAQWIPLPPPACYTLTYCGNDAGGPPAFCIPCSQRVWAGQCTRVSCCIPTRAGYCFIGWNTVPCGKGQSIWHGQTIGPMSSDICLYAQWKRLPKPKPCCDCHNERI